ncbi:hypothetical protein GWK47_054057 [Chionoecetes opilio]|uniref:Uncharacterized protein n=1 Tax=Chionoecetes opilio TaxID=41210 RepID=A0A8J5CP91_CHIOP|nr:hypothetical protein GWK47_054057 [Chionoecetes opilio]
MADQEMEGQDFTEDCAGGDFQGNGMENGGEIAAETGDGKKDSGAADAPGRDDDRTAVVSGAGRGGFHD